MIRYLSLLCVLCSLWSPLGAESSPTIPYAPNAASDLADEIARLVAQRAAATAAGNTALASAISTELNTRVAAVRSAYPTRLGSVVSVQQFGAIGNGVADDTVALQTAIAVSDATGSSLYVPTGTYLVNAWASAVTVSSRLVLRGDGAHLSVIKQTSAHALFDLRGGLDAYGIGFDGTGAVFDWALATAAVESIRVVACRAKNTGDFISWPGTASGSIKDVHVEGNEVENATNSCLFCQIRPTGGYNNVTVIGNRVRGLSRFGVQLGTDDYSVQDSMYESVISGNVIEDVLATGGNESKAIVVYGREANITGNVIKNVRNGNASGTDSCGIYIKTRYFSITGNTLVNCGNDTGGISLKGQQRSDTSQPQGFAGTVTGNTIIQTDTAGRTGIRVGQAGALVANNYLEGLGGDAIYTPTNSLDGITIRGNDIVGHRGTNAIKVNSWGKALIIEGNSILDATCDLGASTKSAIMLNAGTIINQAVVRNNRVINFPTTTARAFRLIGSGGYGSLEVTGNLIDTTDRAIEVAWTAGTCDLLVIRGNTLRNVSAGVTQVIGYGTYPYGSTTKTVIDQNEGFISENSGTATVATGATSVTVTHGLQQPANLTVTPSQYDIQVVPGALGSAASWWISGISSTQFVINTNAAPGGAGATFGWRVRRVVY